MGQLVTIIIPCKDDGHLLSESIESCLNQTWRPIEVIVVDNGSSDNTVEMVHKYQASGVKLLHCNIAGASSARNTGLRASCGDYVQFLDADDLLEKSKIESQIYRLTGEKFASAICKWAIFTDEHRNARSVNETIFKDHDPVDFLVELWTTKTMMAPFSWLLERRVIEAAGEWSDDLCWDDDGEFFTRVALASKRILQCDGAFGFKRNRPNSMCHRTDRPSMKSAFVACQRSTNALLAIEDSYRTKLASAAKYQYFVHLAYPVVPGLVGVAEREIRRLGFSPQKLEFGRKAPSLLSHIIGWKATKVVQVLWLWFKLRLPAFRPTAG